MAKKIYLGSDHAGFVLKEKIKKWLEKKRIPFEDLGNKKYDPKDDYPDFAVKVSRKVIKEKTKGVLFCGSAQGMCIAANKIKGIRAVIPFSSKEAKFAREHNKANIVCFSGWYLPFKRAVKILEVFLKTPFSGEKRHKRRLEKIKRLERGEQ